jgi:hypothetical protein
MEDHAMTGIGEKGCAAGRRSKKPALSFDTQFLLEVVAAGHPLNQGSGLMGVQLITDDMPPRGRGRSRPPPPAHEPGNRLQSEWVHRREPGGGRSQRHGSE